MIVRVFLILISLGLSVPVATAADSIDQEIYGSITESDYEDLMLRVPLNLSPGFKSIEIKVSGMGGLPIAEKVLFCKGLDGVIRWDNICPDLLNRSVNVIPVSSSTNNSLLTYRPLADPNNTTNTLVIAFAALTLLMGAGAASNNVSNRISSDIKRDAESEGTGQPGYLAQLSKGSALSSTLLLGPGDKSKLWKRPINDRIDKAVAYAGTAVSGFSPLATRILSDGNYQRTLIGPLSLLIYPVAIALGIASSMSINQAALPPSVGFIMAMMAIGISDALAGVLTASTFAIATIISGNIVDLDSLLTVAGVSLLAFSPAVIAGAFRPFRRAVWDFASLWERVTDYLVASILTGWVIQQIVLGLPGLSGLQLSISSSARTIALFAVLLIVIRFGFEDLSLYLFPQKLMGLEPNYQSRSITQQFMTTFWKVAIFGVIAGRFIGISIELFIGILLFSAPLILGIFSDRFPKSASLQKWMPTGIIEMLVMTLGGYFLAIVVQDRYPNAKSYVLVSFVILSLPGFILKIISLFGEDSVEDWRITKFGKITYRIFGVIALSALIYIILSGLLISNNV